MNQNHTSPYTSEPRNGCGCRCGYVHKTGLGQWILIGFIGGLIGTGAVWTPAIYYPVPWTLLAPDRWESPEQREELREPLVAVLGTWLDDALTREGDAGGRTERAFKAALDACVAVATTGFSMTVDDDGVRLQCTEPVDVPPEQ